MKSILAALDFSAAMPEVAAKAAALARTTGARLWLVHVAAPEPDLVGTRVGPKYVREDRANTLRQEHRELHALRDKLAESGTDVEALLVQGPTVSTLLENAAELKVDVIVMGTHGRSGIRRMLMGSVCEQVLRESPVPLHIIPIRAEEEEA